MARGGEQHIPRPPGTRPGGPAPWSGLTFEPGAFGLDHIRSRFVNAAPELSIVDHGNAREAAVLVALYEDADETFVVLTKRPLTMPSHRGEIAFPGGKREPNDSGLAAAALREAHEEVGLEPAAVEVLVELDTIATVASAFAITPFVGFLAERPTLVPHPLEVVAAFGVPISDLLHADTYREEMWDLWGAYRSMTFFELPGETVWGATARILTQLLTVVTGLSERNPEGEPNRPLG